jgi:hypothetical protein
MEKKWRWGKKWNGLVRSGADHGEMSGGSNGKSNLAAV